MAHKAPGRYYRKGISLLQLIRKFPDEQAAETWFEARRWGEDRKGLHCPRCGVVDRVRPRASRKPMPWYCGSCARYFSVRTGTCMEESRLPLQKWVFAIYFHMTSLKGISSMKLHRELDITQKTAWFLSHRIRKACETPGSGPDFSGPVEIDETFIGGKRGNMSNSKRKELREAGAGRGGVGKSVVVGARDRASGKVVAEVVEATDSKTLQGFVKSVASEDAKVYTDEAAAYKGIPHEHETVCHSVSEYVRGQAHVNGIESFRAGLNRGYDGTFHHMSPKRVHRYVEEFATRQNLRPQDTEVMMADVVAGMTGKRLMCRDLIADNGLPSGARP